jgi:hypothetical protein
VQQPASPLEAKRYAADLELTQRPLGTAPRDRVKGGGK